MSRPVDSGVPGNGAGRRPPASISVLSGDVHHSYVAQAHFDPPLATPVMQLTCSPLHNQVPLFLRPLMRLGWSPAVARAVRGLARSAGVARPAWTWQRLAGPYFSNAVATLRLDGRAAGVRVEGTRPDGTLAEVAGIRFAHGSETVEPPRPRHQSTDARAPGTVG